MRRRIGVPLHGPEFVPNLDNALPRLLYCFYRCINSPMRARLGSRSICAATRSAAAFPSSPMRLHILTVCIAGSQVARWFSWRCRATSSGSRSLALPLGARPDGQRTRRYLCSRFTVSSWIGRRRALWPLLARTALGAQVEVAELEIALPASAGRRRRGA